MSFAPRERALFLKKKTKTTVKLFKNTQMLQKHPFLNREKTEFHYYDCLPKRPSSDLKPPPCLKKKRARGGWKNVFFHVDTFGGFHLDVHQFSKTS